MTTDLSSPIAATLERVVATLKGLDFVVLGGQAVALHGHRDAVQDLAVGLTIPLKAVVAMLEMADFVAESSTRFHDPRTDLRFELVRLPACAAPSCREPTFVQAGALELPVAPVELLVALAVKRGQPRDEADVVGLLKVRTPHRALVAQLLHDLGADLAAYDRLVERARREQPPPLELEG